MKEFTKIMIKIQHKDAYCVPYVFCDGCGEIIRDAKQAIVLWDPQQDGASVFHVHKGVCDNRVSKGKPHLGWESLDYHLRCLQT